MDLFTHARRDSGDDGRERRERRFCLEIDARWKEVSEADEGDWPHQHPAEHVEQQQDGSRPGHPGEQAPPDGTRRTVHLGFEHRPSPIREAPTRR